MSKQNQLYKENINADFLVTHSISQNWQMEGFHFHDVYEIYYTMTDKIKYFINGKTLELEKGDLLVFNNQDLHRSIIPKNTKYERILIVFNPQYIQNLSTPDTDLLECFLHRDVDFNHRIHLDREQSSLLLALLEKAQRYLQSDTYGADVYTRLCLGEILLLVNQFYHTVGDTPPHGHEGDYVRIKPVIQFIHQHLDEPLTLERLSDTFYLSKYHLGYLFKKATGFTICEYIIHNRIMKARELLKKKYSVSQVCEMVGFVNHAHFIRTFKKYVGIPPKQYALRG